MKNRGGVAERVVSRFALWAAIGLVVAATWALAAPGADVQINSDTPGTVQNEIRITQDPTSADLVVAYNDNAGSSSSPLGISYSSNKGQSWTDTQLGIPLHPVSGSLLNVIFDPYIDADSQGNIYAGYIATDGSLGGASGIYIERSQNGGVAWSGPTTIAFNGAASGPVDPSYRFNDRPDMTVDANDDVYVVWIKDVGVGLPTSDIYFSKSPPPVSPAFPPTGLDFTGVSAGSVMPQTVNDSPNGTDRANAPDVAIAPDGTVYVAWIDVDVTNASPKPATLMIDRSFDGGVTFGMDNTAQTITAPGNHLSTGSGSADDARSGSYPAIAVDPSNSQTVYMVYTADPSGSDEADIFFTKSTDGGIIWSSPTRVNDDTTTNDQLHPAIAVKPGGTIDVAWYDKRNSVNDNGWDVYFAQSTNGGATFSTNVRITDQSFVTPTNAPGTEPWLGEYLGLEVDATNAYIAFTSGINDSKGDVFFDSFAPAAPPAPPSPTGSPSPTPSPTPSGCPSPAGSPSPIPSPTPSGCPSPTGSPSPGPSPSPSPTPPGQLSCAITGTKGPDTLVGTGQGEKICARAGRDSASGKGGDDLILLGRGNDNVTGRGGKGDDIVKGGRGNDKLIGGKGRDIARGGPGRDRCRAEVERGCEL